MKRRSFLQTILGLAGTTVLPVNSTIRKQSLEPKKLKLLETSIAGFQYYEGERLFNHIKIGDTVQLRRTRKTNTINVRLKSIGRGRCWGTYQEWLI